MCYSRLLVIEEIIRLELVCHLLGINPGKQDFTNNKILNDKNGSPLKIEMYLPNIPVEFIKQEILKSHLWDSRIFKEFYQFNIVDQGKFILVSFYILCY